MLECSCICYGRANLIFVRTFKKLITLSLLSSLFITTLLTSKTIRSLIATATLVSWTMSSLTLVHI